VVSPEKQKLRGRSNSGEGAIEGAVEGAMKGAVEMLVVKLVASEKVKFDPSLIKESPKYNL
jgi:hypothetical protein